jgi:hypothetical protein
VKADTGLREILGEFGVGIKAKQGGNRKILVEIPITNQMRIRIKYIISGTSH